MTNRLYEKNRGYAKLLDYSTKIGWVGGLIGVIVGNFFKIPELVEWSEGIGFLCLGYQIGKDVTENSFKKVEESKLEKDVKNDS